MLFTFARAHVFGDHASLIVFFFFPPGRRHNQSSPHFLTETRRTPGFRGANPACSCWSGFSGIQLWQTQLRTHSHSHTHAHAREHTFHGRRHRAHEHGNQLFTIRLARRRRRRHTRAHDAHTVLLSISRRRVSRLASAAPRSTYHTHVLVCLSNCVRSHTHTRS